MGGKFQSLIFLCLYLGLDGAIISQKTDNNLRFRVSEFTPDTIKRTKQTLYLKAVVTKDGAVDENDDWKFCTWTRASDGANCRFSYICEGFLCDIGSGTFHIESQCSQGLNDVTFIGEDPNVHNRICGLEVPNVGNEDNSLWNVTLQDCHAYGCGGDSGSDRFASHSTQITVLKSANVDLSSTTLGVPGHNMSVGSYHIATCKLNAIRPQAELTWRMRNGPYYGTVSDINLHYNPDGSVDMSQDATVIIDQSMNGALFECVATIKNQTEAQEVIFTSSDGITINVKPESSPSCAEIGYTCAQDDTMLPIQVKEDANGACRDLCLAKKTCSHYTLDNSRFPALPVCSLHSSCTKKVACPGCIVATKDCV